MYMAWLPPKKQRLLRCKLAELKSKAVMVVISRPADALAA